MQSLFCEDDGLEDFLTSATKFCHEGRARSAAEIMTFLASSSATLFPAAGVLLLSESPRLEFF